MAITGLTRNQFVGLPAQGFESLRLRFYTLADLAGAFLYRWKLQFPAIQKCDIKMLCEDAHKQNVWYNS